MPENLEENVAILQAEVKSQNKFIDKHTEIITDTSNKINEIDKKVMRLATIISITTSICTALCVYFIKDTIIK